MDNNFAASDKQYLQNHVTIHRAHPYITYAKQGIFSTPKKGIAAYAFDTHHFMCSCHAAKM